VRRLPKPRQKPQSKADGGAAYLTLSLRPRAALAYLSMDNFFKARRYLRKKAG